MLSICQFGCSFCLFSAKSEHEMDRVAMNLQILRIVNRERRRFLQHLAGRFLGFALIFSRSPQFLCRFDLIGIWQGFLPGTAICTAKVSITCKSVQVLFVLCQVTLPLRQKSLPAAMNAGKLVRENPFSALFVQGSGHVHHVLACLL